MAVKLSPAKRKIIRAGRRGGKTTLASDVAVEKFLDGKRVLYAAPVADQLTSFWRNVSESLKELLVRKVYKANQSSHSIELNRAIMVEDSRATQRIRAKTAFNADTLRGDYADFLILDEFQLMNESAWAQVGAPMLLDNDGDAMFIYTPPSLHSRRRGAITKAQDPRHAAKQFQQYASDPTGRSAAFHWSSHDNPHISAQALEEIQFDMTAASIRQEIEAEDVDEAPGALWTRELIEKNRLRQVPETLVRIVVGVDPSGSTENEAGIVAVGKGESGHGYVLADDSLMAASPLSWGQAAVKLYNVRFADRIVAERNYGGDMVRETIRTVDPEASYKDVIAARSKQVRAEPIAALYERGMMHHVGDFPDLEDEMVSWVPGDSNSPNRMDAMVWAATEAMLSPSAKATDGAIHGRQRVTFENPGRVTRDAMSRL